LNIIYKWGLSYNQTNKLCSVNQLACEAPRFEYTLCTFACLSFTDSIIFMGLTTPECFIFYQYYYFYYSIYDLIPNLIERLGLKCFLVFSVDDHIRVWILLHFIYIILFSWLIWDLDISKGLSLLVLSWYKESRELSFGP
jgi:hypothetical protein